MAKGRGLLKSSRVRLLVFGVLAVCALLAYVYFRQKSGIVSRGLSARVCDEKTPCPSGYYCNNTMCMAKPATLGLSILYGAVFFIALYLLAHYFL